MLYLRMAIIILVKRTMHARDTVLAISFLHALQQKGDLADLRNVWYCNWRKSILQCIYASSQNDATWDIELGSGA